MLRVLRKVSEKTGESEEACREWLKEEMKELEEEVLAIKRLLSSGSEATKAVEPKKPKNAPKKKTQADVAVTAEASEAATVEEPKKPKNAPKKKAQAAEAVTAEASSEAATVEEPKKPKNAPKKKAQAAEAVTATEAVSSSEAATVVVAVEPKKPKNAPKKKAQAAVAVVEEVLEEVVEAVATGAEEEVEVEEIEYQGVRYLKSVKGVVYDIETSEEIGRWNEESKSIEVD